VHFTASLQPDFKAPRIAAHRLGQSNLRHLN
jgi:hypothetical protein